MGARSVSWTRGVSVAKELSNKMFMSAHVNYIRFTHDSQKYIDVTRVNPLHDHMMVVV
jgi:hypothetical protein